MHSHTVPSCCLKLVLFADVHEIYMRAAEAVASKFKDPQVTCLIEALDETSSGAVVLRGSDLNTYSSNSSSELKDSDMKALLCSYFFSTSKDITSFSSIEKVYFTSNFKFYYSQSSNMIS